jgi:hypothetical protein
MFVIFLVKKPGHPWIKRASMKPKPDSAPSVRFTRKPTGTTGRFIQRAVWGLLWTILGISTCVICFE